MTPFEQWFSSDFGMMLHNVPAEQGLLSSGFTINHASWDRKAAYLLWDLMGRPNAHWVQQTAHLYEHKPDAIDTVCSECGLRQVGSPSGISCPNGHGGSSGEAAVTRYWYHPESDSLFSTAPYEAFPGDPLVEQLDRQTYESLQQAKLDDDLEDLLADTPPTTATDEIEDLLA